VARQETTMPKIYEFVVNETYTVPCRYQVEAESEPEARRKAEAGDTVQNEIDGREQLAGRNVGEVVSVFGDDDD
jgi:hypothetical protein